MVSKVDIIILIFIAFHIFRGYVSGFSKSFFISVRFIASFLISRFIYLRFSGLILQSAVYERYREIIEDFLLKTISPYVYFALDMDRKILAVSLFIIMYIAISIAMHGFSSIFSRKSMKSLDKNLGFLFGGAKSIIYIMILITLLDPLIQVFFTTQQKEYLSDSRLLKHFYTYNFVADYFEIF
ncbi:putative membrane protein required for colicin V production [Acetoanaerobium pronyense]|uniref:Membrane protein required for colicin V production n=1 Tax=Acetoanaerobium pronyense TaxID=1482736 RepID=A0ABS4KLB6_9FIRM|nr:CvpA family protein [Acetoanaerobium pronyense]MBP2028550.1 putative membrane protein required for colicin V production [Acetoanaerobium pronyense]